MCLVYRGTHKRYDELVQRCIELSGENLADIETDPSWRPDYTKLLEHEPHLADSIVTCELQPGDHILWDDRCIHGNSPGRGPSPTGSQLARAIVMVSMSPLSLLDEQTRERRREMASLGMMGGHGSHHAPPVSEMEAAKAAGPGDKATIRQLNLTAQQRAMVPIDSIATI